MEGEGEGEEEEETWLTLMKMRMKCLVSWERSVMSEVCHNVSSFLELVGNFDEPSKSEV